MKKKTSCLIFNFFLLSMTTAWGQNQVSIVTSSKDSQTKVNLERTIFLENNSKTEEVIINIEEQTQRFELMINSSVSAGKLTIEIYDPNGTKQGNFSVGTQLNSDKSEKVNGNIIKSLNEPQTGDWKVKIIPAEATGIIGIRTSFIE